MSNVTFIDNSQRLALTFSWSLEIYSRLITCTSSPSHPSSNSSTDHWRQNLKQPTFRRSSRNCRLVWSNFAMRKLAEVSSKPIDLHIVSTLSRVSIHSYLVQTNGSSLLDWLSRVINQMCHYRGGLHLIGKISSQCLPTLSACC